ncbi:MAG: hypothetical protein JSW36_15140 [Burkholderiales bacterium]|nr:MAG: hypothetical protein JSW36_15140 [Burkholderiales bacterium]
MKTRTEQGEQIGADRRSGRAWFILAGLFVAMFVANVALRMLHIKLGVTLWRLGDVGEFLVVLIAMSFFVAGVLAVEESPGSPTTVGHNHPEGAES